MEDGDAMRAMMAAAMAAAGGGAGADMFPVKTKQWVQVVGGHSTDFVLCLFANCVLVIATQLGKIGTMIRISKDEATSSTEEGETTFTVDTLLGKRDDPALVVCGRQIVEDISQFSTRPLLLCIALQDNRHASAHSHLLRLCVANDIRRVTSCLGGGVFSRATIREVVEAIKANRLWGQKTEMSA